MRVLLSEFKQGVLHLTLNRPEKANALSEELIESLGTEFRLAVESSEVRVVTLTGAGKNFCAGADTSELKASPEGARRAVTRFVSLVETIASLEKPFLVGMNGPAAGGGTGLAVMGDLVIATLSVHFRTPELKLGLFPFLISPILISTIGRKRFFEMVYTGLPVSAEIAKEWGLINQIVPSAELSDRLSQLAGSLAAVPGDVVTRGKRALLSGMDFQAQGEELLKLMGTTSR